MSRGDKIFEAGRRYTSAEGRIQTTRLLIAFVANASARLTILRSIGCDPPEDGSHTRRDEAISKQLSAVGLHAVLRVVVGRRKRRSTTALPLLFLLTFMCCCTHWIV